MEEALREAPGFLSQLREGKISAADFQLDDRTIRIFHAACRLLASPDAGGPGNSLQHAERLYDFIHSARWPEPDFAEKAELLCDCAFAGWRISRRLRERGAAGKEQRWLQEFGNTLALPSPIRFQVDQFLAAPVSEQLEKVKLLHLGDPEMLLALLGQLPKMCDTAPARVLEEASSLYRFLEAVQLRYSVGSVLYDEREYFLGETALIAGAACRFLSQRADARRWFDLSEAWFVATESAAANIARLRYQRLALRTDEHGDLESVLELLPHLIGNFERLEMQSDAMKARFLQATVLKEMGRTHEAIEPFRHVIVESRHLRNNTLLAAAYVNLAQIYCFLSEAEEAMKLATEATPLLARLDHHVALAKLHWGIGFLLRSKGDLLAAIESYRTAQKQFAAIEMRADVAAVHLVLADLLLDAGQPTQAEWEIRAALPVIDEYKLVPEGIAALSLLRESLRRRQIDRHALRELHGYFRDQQN